LQVFVRPEIENLQYLAGKKVNFNNGPFGPLPTLGD
jgi:hypothetical protein